MQTDIFESEFDKEKLDTVLNQKLILQAPPPEPSDAVLKMPSSSTTRLKFSAQSFTAGFNNDVLGTQYQPFTGSLPIMLGGNEPFNAMFKAAVLDLFEDIRFSGALRLPFFGGSSSTRCCFGTGGTSFVLLYPPEVLFLMAAGNGMHGWII